MTSVPQMTTLTTDAVPIASSEVPNTQTRAVSDDDVVQNQLEGSDTNNSEEFEDPQEEQIHRDSDAGNVKPILVEVTTAQDIPPPEECEDKLNKPRETPMADDLNEKKKKRSNDKRIVKPNSSLMPGPGPSVMYSIKNVSGLHMGPNITINMSSKKEKSPKMSPRRIPKDVEEMFKSTAPVTEVDLDTVSQHVGRAWRQVGRRLNFSDGELDQLKADYIHEGMKEVIYQMLLAWKREASDKATAGILCSALWSAEQCDAAEKLASR